MAAPSLMLPELWESCPGPSAHQRRLSANPATGRSDTGGGSQPTPKSQALLVTWLHLLIPAQLMQGPVRKPQKAELQSQQVSSERPEAAGHSALPCLI